MKKSKDSSAQATKLRRRAEDRLRERKTKEARSATGQDAQRVLHELQVHQVELEMQNEELMAARSEIEAGLERYTDLYDFAPVGYFTLGPDGTIAQVNITGAGLLGTERSRLVRRSLGHFVTPDELGQWDQHLRNVLHLAEQQTCELTLRRADGSTFYARLESLRQDRPAAEGPAREPVPVIRVAMSDITEHKYTEQALREAREELEQRVRLRTADLARTIETLREEVAARILAEESLRKRSDQLRALASELALTEHRERRRLAQVLHDGLQQLLAGALFRLAAIERAGSKAARRVAADVHDLLAESIETSRSLTAELSPPILMEGGLIPALEWLAWWEQKKHGLAVSLDVQGEVGAIEEHLTVLLFQATRELLFNVIKHAGVKSAHVKVVRLHDQIQITVADKGHGFDPAHARADGRPLEGFGLFSIRERIGLLGGRMEIHAVPGRGSRFTLVAPLTAASRMEPPPNRDLDASFAVSHSDHPTAAANGKIRVALADDHIVMRQGLASLLREEPDMVIVGEASDGESAVSMIRELRPDVVLMDMRMPGMSGVEATRIIHTELPGVRIIGLSMSEGPSADKAMREAGAVAYFAKSGPSQAVVNAIRACAGHSAGQEATRADGCGRPEGSARPDGKRRRRTGRPRTET